MELSMEKTGVTDVREGFDFLGYRVVQAKALRTGHWVGKLFIPKGKLNDLRLKIKVKVKGIPTGCSLAEVISDLNPLILGWRNYYRYAIRAYREFWSVAKTVSCATSLKLLQKCETHQAS